MTIYKTFSEMIVIHLHRLYMKPCNMKRGFSVYPVHTEDVLKAYSDDNLRFVSLSSPDRVKYRTKIEDLDQIAQCAV